MSRTLYWRPGSVQPKNRLPDELKREIARKFWGHDGGARDADQCPLTEDDIPYLQELVARGVDGAAALLTALREHDNHVVVWIAGYADPPQKRT